MDNLSQKPKWYFTPGAIVAAFLIVGPLALPLVILNPQLSKKAKIIASAAILIVSVLLAIAMKKSLQNITEYYTLLTQPM